MTATVAQHPETVEGATLVEWMSDTSPDLLVVDVRSAAEYDAVHIRGSYHVPIATLAEHSAEMAELFADGERVVLVCQSGARAEQARQRLASVGLAHARVLDGGVPAYASAGGQVVRGRQAWALERQVRLVAGTLVVSGLAAGRFFSPRARLLTAAIGSGLTFSALTNTCAMGVVLAKLPWNRGVCDPEPSETLARLRNRAHAR